MPPRGVPSASMVTTESVEAEPVTESETVSGALSAIEAMLAECGVSSEQARRIASGDLRGTTPEIKSRIAAWYAAECGLHASEVAVITARDGNCIPYVKASGVLRFAREKYKSIDHEAPTVLAHGNKAFVVVFARVVLSDGREVRDFACRPLTDHNAVMACSTAATIRVLRIAVGIPIPSEGEL